MASIDINNSTQPIPRINIFLDRKDYIYHPGDTLTGTYRILDAEADQIESVEMSVLWRTEGKGDEDMVVIHFHSLSSRLEDWINPRSLGKIETVLPATPLSYDGQIVKIRWCVRVRMKLVSGEIILAEQGFWVKKPQNIRLF